MILENFNVGLKVPNYRALCKLLGEDIKSSDSKTAQLNRWQQYFSFERSGNAYIIMEIYEAPRLNTDGRMSFMQYVEPLLLHFLALHSYITETEQTFNDWGISIGLTTGNAYNKKTITEYSEFGFNSLAIRRAAYEIMIGTKDALMRTVRALTKRGTIIDEEKVYIVEATGIQREATVEEKSYIDTVKNDVLKSMGASTMFSIQINPSKKEEFYDMVRETYAKERNWESAYTLLSIKTLDMDTINRYRDIRKRQPNQRIV